MISEKIRRFFKSVLSDASHPVAFLWLVGLVFYLQIFCFGLVLDLAGYTMPIWLLVIILEAAFFFWGLQGLVEIRRKESFTRHGHPIHGRDAVIWGWVHMLFFWGLCGILLFIPLVISLLGR
jgi:hypothetical protein